MAESSTHVLQANPREMVYFRVFGLTLFSYETTVHKMARLPEIGFETVFYFKKMYLRASIT